MLKEKKMKGQIIGATLTVAMIFTAIGGATMADGITTINNGDNLNTPSVIMPINDKAENFAPAKKGSYGDFKGTVIEVRKDDKFKENGIYYVMLENSKGEKTEFMVNAKTYVMGMKVDKIKKGDKLTGYYDLNAPAVMIFPARYTATAIVKDSNKAGTTFVGYFNNKLVSADNTLQINNVDKGKVFDKKGKLYKGSLKNKTLLVQYKASTKSIPAQTNPVKIVVLSTKTIK